MTEVTPKEVAKEEFLLIDMKDYLLRESPDEFLEQIKKELEAEIFMRKITHEKYIQFAHKMSTLKLKLRSDMNEELNKYEQELLKEKKAMANKMKKLKKDINEEDSDDMEESEEEPEEVVKKPIKKGRPKKNQ